MYVYTKAFHAPPFITHKVVREIKLIESFMYLTLFTRPKSILELSVAKALRSV